MKVRNWSIHLATASIVALMTGYAFGKEPTDEQRYAARLYARVEAPLASRNQKAYCEAFYGTEDYRGYRARACETGIKVGVRKPEECTAKAVDERIKEDRKKCLAQNKAEFDATIDKHTEGRAGFVGRMAENGIDGEKLIAEERAKLK